MHVALKRMYSEVQSLSPAAAIVTAPTLLVQPGPWWHRP